MDDVLLLKNYQLSEELFDDSEYRACGVGLGIILIEAVHIRLRGYTQRNHGREKN